MITYAEAHDIPVPVTAKKPYSTDRNLLHISYESGILEDPWFDASDEVNKDMFRLSVAPEDAPDEAERVILYFTKGDCTGLEGAGVTKVLEKLGHKGDGKKLSPLLVMRALNQLGGQHGIGRVDMVENRFVGMKSRGVYETPGGAILHFAHRQMESHHGSRGHAFA